MAKKFPNILIIGCMGSGKDTVADTLHELADYRTLKLGRWIREHVDLLYYDETPDRKRQLYQEYGQWARKNYGPDVWNVATLNSMSMLAGAFSSAPYPFVIADGRQVNEVEFWKKRGFHVVGVQADPFVRALRLRGRDGFNQETAFKHETEISAQYIMDNGLCDSMIDNTGICIAEFKRKITAWLVDISI